MLVLSEILDKYHPGQAELTCLLCGRRPEASVMAELASSLPPELRRCWHGRPWNACVVCRDGVPPKPGRGGKNVARGI